MKDSPALLLLITGFFLGLTFPLGKLASEASIPPLVWAWLIAAGASLVLSVIHRFMGGKVNLRREYIQYFLLSSVCSLVLPNVLIFTVIPHLGSGFTGILFTLTPIFTLAFSSIWQVRIPPMLGMMGIAVGFTGAVIVTLTRGEVGQAASINWILAGLCIPVSLAIGNVYRTIAWPKEAHPMELAIGSNFSAAILLLLLIIIFSQTAEMPSLLSIKGWALVQIVVSAAMFSVFFRLQQIGGPSYLSQISYVAAGVALLTGTVFFAEQYSKITWIGAAVIVAGIGLSIMAQRKQPA